MGDESQEIGQLCLLYLKKQLPLRTLAILSNPRKNLSQDYQDFIPYIEFLRTEKLSRGQLLRYIYENEHLVKAYAFLRLPTESKRALINLLINHCHDKFPWLRSKMIHFMAFRPDIFDQKVKNQYLGRLYRIKEIPKGGSGRRILEIPNPPLRRIQKILLQEIVNPTMEALPDYVCGCRPSNRRENVVEIGPRQRTGDSIIDIPPPPVEAIGSIYHHAALHLHQGFVVSFDLKNFFRSVKMDRHIIPALLKFKNPLLTIKDGKPFEFKSISYPWTVDAAVLFAKLVTRHGHLPQGASTSPGVANIAFHQYDEKIIKEIDVTFGKGICYSRYVDDITVSISRQSARNNNILTEAAFMVQIDDILKKVFEDTGFHINRQKTRAGNLDEGFKITGLFVRNDQIDVPRESKRYIRALLYRIKKDGFVKCAKNLFGDAVKNVVVKINTNGKRAHVMEGHKWSVERLASIMLRAMCPDLSIATPRFMEYVSTSPEGGVTRWEPGETVSGKKGWQQVERLLTYLWTNEARAGRQGKINHIKDWRDQDVCTVHGETVSDYFILRKEEALACAFLWHHINGLKAFLKVGSPDSCYEPIRNIHRQLECSIREIKIICPEQPKGPEPKIVKGTIIITPEQQTLQSAADVYSYISDHWDKSTAQHITPEHVRQADFFKRVVRNSNDLKTWIQAAAFLCFGRMKLLPPNAKIDGIDIFELLRLLDDQLQNKRFANDYKTPTHWLRSLKRDGEEINIHQLDDACCHKAQTSLLDLIRNAYQKSNNDMMQAGIGKWKSRLKINEWYEPIESRLHNEVDKFRDLHGKLTSTDETALFEPYANKALAEKISIIREPITKGTPPAIWNKLFEIGQAVIMVTTESLRGAKGPDTKKMLGLFRERVSKDYRYFLTAFKLRCRFAHIESPEQKNDWRELQGHVASMLGREMPKFDREEKEQLYTASDLKLTPLEGTEVKLKLIQGICSGLKKCLS